MTVLDIITYPDARLKQVADEVKTFDSGLLEFIQNLAPVVLVLRLRKWA